MAFKKAEKVVAKCRNPVPPTIRYTRSPKYQEMKEELEKIREVKATVVQLVTGAFRPLTPKLAESIPDSISEMFVQKSKILATADMSLRLPDPDVSLTS